MPLPLPNRRPSPRDRRLVESQASAAASRAEAIAESSARQEYNRADARVGTRRDVHGVCEQLLAGVDRRYSELATGRHVDPVDPVVTATRVLDQDVYARRTPWVDDGVQGLRIAGSSPYHGSPRSRGLALSSVAPCFLFTMAHPRCPCITMIPQVSSGGSVGPVRWRALSVVGQPPATYSGYAWYHATTLEALVTTTVRDQLLTILGAT